MNNMIEDEIDRRILISPVAIVLNEMPLIIHFILGKLRGGEKVTINHGGSIVVYWLGHTKGMFVYF